MKRLILMGMVVLTVAFAVSPVLARGRGRVNFASGGFNALTPNAGFVSQPGPFFPATFFNPLFTVERQVDIFGIDQFVVHRVTEPVVARTVTTPVDTQGTTLTTPGFTRPLTTALPVITVRPDPGRP